MNLPSFSVNDVVAFVLSSPPIYGGNQMLVVMGVFEVEGINDPILVDYLAIELS